MQIQMRWLVKSCLIWICTVCKGICIGLQGWKGQNFNFTTLYKQQHPKEVLPIPTKTLTLNALAAEDILFLIFLRK